MKTILDQILEEKINEVILLKNRPLIDETYTRKSLINTLTNSRSLSIITEYKKASPSKGVINNNIDPVSQAKIYEEAGAAAISVLTDTKFFKGSLGDMKNIKKSVQLPILCKDFIIDKIQIDFAKMFGADIILLIVKAMNQNRLIELYNYAKVLGLEVLVEVHNLEDLSKALHAEAELIGVNNRNLNDFSVDLSITEALGPVVKKSGAFLISASGIHTKQDVKRVRDSGADGILVGESLMKSENVSMKMSDYRISLMNRVMYES
ncbi:MAG: indole-3-glycerol phosphate synthase [Bacillales bacterium]|jgi:indole-3-glycerol phosphate synthase|nr:indole-3-glycerol phosphate synthase [Bacillales bacterium]